MRLIILALLALLVSASAATYLYQENGYVLIAWGPWTLESSVPVFVLLVIAVIAIGILTLRLGAGIIRLPRQWSTRRRERRRAQARRHLTQGLIELNEGRWSHAERTLLRDAEHSDTPLLHYLSAARAAQLQGEDQRRDRYLKRAYECTPDALTAVLMTQAELQLAHGQYEQALKTLQNMAGQNPDNLLRLRLLRRCHEALRQWHELKALLPRLRDHKALPEAELAQLSLKVYGELLFEAARQQDLAQLRSQWREIPRSFRQNPTLVGDYVKCLQELGETEEAASLIEDQLKQRWSEDLALTYGRLEVADPQRRLAKVQQWLGDYGQQPVLLLTAARLNLQSRIWGTARQYLENSIHMGPRPDTYHELARLLSQLGEHDKAKEAYAAGLELALKHHLPPAASATPGKPSTAAATA